MFIVYLGFSDSSKLKEYADDNSKFDINGTKFFKLVENTMGKGEIDRLYGRTVNTRVRLTLYHTITTFNNSEKRVF